MKGWQKRVVSHMSMIRCSDSNVWKIYVAIIVSLDIQRVKAMVNTSISKLSELCRNKESMDKKR